MFCEIEIEIEAGCENAENDEGSFQGKKSYCGMLNEFVGWMNPCFLLCAASQLV